jgi:glycopeptide antibiotics resistance protein
MKKFFLILSIIAFVAVAVSFSNKVHAQTADLCGGTGGNGEIVSIGSNTFTLQLHEGGEKGGGNLIVHLTDQTRIETPTGLATLSDLNIGDRVTLVGNNHRDGTFTADTVVVCSGTGLTSSPQADQANPMTVRNKNPEAYEKVSGILNVVTLLLVGLIWLGISAFLLLKKKKGFVFILFFTIFSIYLYKVLDYTLLQFQSLLLLQHFVPDLIVNGFTDGTNVNLIPIATLTQEDVKTSLLNVLMMMPFGFGLPFITHFRMKNVVVAGLLFSIVIELLQLITGFMANTTFRVADINDLLFNTAGVAIGYILFIGFVRMYRHAYRNWEMSTNPILRYIAERSQVDKQ